MIGQISVEGKVRCHIGAVDFLRDETIAPLISRVKLLLRPLVGWDCQGFFAALRMTESSKGLCYSLLIATHFLPA
jgi:hypothetical protein